MAALRCGDGTAHFQPPDGISEAYRKHVFMDGDKDLMGLGSGDSQLIARFLSEGEAGAAFAALVPGGEICYQQWYHMPDKRKPHAPLKRLQRVKVAMADPSAHGLPWYRFPVNDQQRYGILPMSPCIRSLCHKVNTRLGASFNHAVVLFYEDGNECIGYHKDKTLDLDEVSPIVSISLGRPGRPYVLRDDIFKPATEYEVLLPHGGLFALGPETNKSFYHAVRQTAEGAMAGPRVSVTFRCVATFQASDGTLVGKGAEFSTLNWPAELNGQHRVDDDFEKETDISFEFPIVSAKKPGTSQRSKRVKDRSLITPEEELCIQSALDNAGLDILFKAGSMREAGQISNMFLAAKVGHARMKVLSRHLGARLGTRFKAWQCHAQVEESS